MMLSRRILAIGVPAFAALVAASCGGVSSPTALTEPLRIQNGAFKRGALPGSPPVAEGAPEAPPSVTLVESLNGIAYPGQSGKSIGGRTSTDAVSVAVRFFDLGTGYWVFPVDAPDPQANGELTWQGLADIGRDIAPGLHPIGVVAIDAQGHAGSQKNVPLCVSSAIPDGLNACDPTLPPPADVVSLGWDTDVDLDLVVVTPDGKTVDPKHITTAGTGDGGTIDRAQLASPSTGVLDRDSNVGCAIDGYRRESLVFKEAPKAGRYQVYARLFDACGNAPVHFTVTLSRAQLRPDGVNLEQVEAARRNGIMTSLDADGGRTRGLFVTEFTFP